MGNDWQIWGGAHASRPGCLALVRKHATTKNVRPVTQKLDRPDGDGARIAAKLRGNVAPQPRDTACC